MASKGSLKKALKPLAGMGVEDLASPEQRKEAASALKKAANERFSKREYHKAIGMYDQAIRCVNL